MNQPDAKLEAFLDRLGHRFADSELLRDALTHRSWAAEHAAAATNERLEFLGDAVLGWAIADLCYREFPNWGEGRLTGLRKSVVNAQALAEVARSLDLGGLVRLGVGEERAGGADKVSILSDALEAVLGAVYLDGGADVARLVIDRLFAELVAQASTTLARLDEKSALQEIAARIGLEPPAYTFKADGPDHDKSFTATVKAGRVFGSGTGTSKKAAEQAAAAQAVGKLLRQHTELRNEFGEPNAAVAPTPTPRGRHE